MNIFELNDFGKFNDFFQLDNNDEEKRNFFEYFQALTDEEKQQQIRAYQYEFNIKQIEKSHSKPSKVYNCKKCKNTGTIPKLYWQRNILDESKGEFKIYESLCNCYKLKNSLMEMKRNNLLPMLQKKKFSNFTTGEKFQQTIKAKAEQYLELIKKGINKSFFIGGQTGCGKTHICCAILGQLVNEGIFIKYFDYINDIDKLKKLQFKDVDEFQAKKDEYKNADILYIDDFMYGENPSEADIKLLFDIINNRYNNDKPIIISSEKMLLDICNINASIGGRIREMTRDFNCNISKEESKNYRMRKGA